MFIRLLVAAQPIKLTKLPKVAPAFYLTWGLSCVCPRLVHSKLEEVDNMLLIGQFEVLKPT